MTLTLANSQQQVVFVTITSRQGAGMFKQIPMSVAEILVWFLSTQWALITGLMIREFVLLYIAIVPVIIFHDVPWSYVLQAIKAWWT